MLKIVSHACGGELNHVDILRNCGGLLCAIAVIILWSFCCFSLFANYGGLWL